PSRMGWDQYLWVGSTVQGGLYNLFGSIGAVIDVAALIALALLAYFVREHARPGFHLALAAALLFALRSFCGGCSSIRSTSSSRNGLMVRCRRIGLTTAPAGSGATPSFRSWSLPASPLSSPRCSLIPDGRFARSRPRCRCR